LAAVLTKRTPIRSYVELVWRDGELVCQRFLPRNPKTQFYMKPGCKWLQDPASITKAVPLHAFEESCINFLVDNGDMCFVGVQPLNNIPLTRNHPRWEIIAALDMKSVQSSVYHEVYQTLDTHVPITSDSVTAGHK
jgi:hypothetical protein